jgi:nucleotide-binding universal stress UspA family protein
MTVVLGFDDTAGAQRALEVAVDIAARFEEPLVVVYGLEPPGASAGEEFREHEAALEEIGARATAHAVELAAGRGVRTEVVLIRERPVDALLDVAERHDARLIAVGSRAESPLRGAVLGSVAHKLLHTSTRPVLVVPA